MDRKTPRKLNELISHLVQDQPRPQRAFVRDYLHGMLATGTAQRRRVARWLVHRASPSVTPTNTWRALRARERRLCRGLTSPRLDIEELVRRYHELIASIVTTDDGAPAHVLVRADDHVTRRIVRRPTAHGAAPSILHLNSPSGGLRAVMGYPVLTYDLVRTDGRRVPLLHWLYSRTAPDPISGMAWRSDHATLLEALDLATPAVGARTWWCFDAAFACTPSLRAFDARGLRWIVRLPSGYGHLRLHVHGESQVTLDEMLARLDPDAAPFVEANANGRPHVRMDRVRVHLPGTGSSEREERVCALAVVWFGDAERRPATFLVSEWVEDVRALAAVVLGATGSRGDLLGRRPLDDMRPIETRTVRSRSLVSFRRTFFLSTIASGLLALASGDGPPTRRGSPSRARVRRAARAVRPAGNATVPRRAPRRRPTSFA